MESNTVRSMSKRCGKICVYAATLFLLPLLNPFYRTPAGEQLDDAGRFLSESMRALNAQTNLPTKQVMNDPQTPSDASVDAPTEIDADNPVAGSEEGRRSQALNDDFSESSGTSVVSSPTGGTPLLDDGSPDGGEWGSSSEGFSVNGPYGAGKSNKHSGGIMSIPIDGGDSTIGFSGNPPAVRDNMRSSGGYSGGSGSGGANMPTVGADGFANGSGSSHPGGISDGVHFSGEGGGLTVNGGGVGGVDGGGSRTGAMPRLGPRSSDGLGNGSRGGGVYVSGRDGTTTINDFNDSITNSPSPQNDAIGSSVSPVGSSSDTARSKSDLDPLANGGRFPQRGEWSGNDFWGDDAATKSPFSPSLPKRPETATGTDNPSTAGNTNDAPAGQSSAPSPSSSSRRQPVGTDGNDTDDTGEPSANRWATIVLWLTIAIAFILLFLILRDRLRKRSARKLRAKNDVVDEDAESVTAQMFMNIPEDEVDRLASEGYFDEAIHLLLLRGLIEMHERMRIAIAFSQTSREILRQVPLDLRTRTALADLVNRVEISRFGMRPSTKEEFLACRKSYDILTADLSGRRS